MSGVKLRVGILSTANIAKKNVLAIFNSKHCAYVGCASRDLSKAQAFNEGIKQCTGIDTGVTAYGSYEELLNDPHIDCVYIPLPTSMHFEWVSKAAQASKHIIVEKPIALTYTEAEEMYKVCSENGVILMDGVMFVHGNRCSTLRSLLENPLYRNVQRIHSSFSFKGNEEFFSTNIRCNADLDRLGALGDLGWYNIRTSLIAFEGLKPRKLKAHCRKYSDDGIVPYDMTIELSFDEDPSTWNKLAFIHCSFIMPFHQEYTIFVNNSLPLGCDKLITCDDFCLPRSQLNAKLYIENHAETGGGFYDYFTRVMSTREEVDCGSITESQEQLMFDHMAEYVLKEKLPSKVASSKPSLDWLRAHTLMAQAVCDASVESAQNGGVVVDVYHNDDL